MIPSLSGVELREHDAMASVSAAPNVSESPQQVQQSQLGAPCVIVAHESCGCPCVTPTDAFRGGSIATFIINIVVTLLLLASLCVNSVMRVTASGTDQAIHIRLHGASYSNGGMTMKANLDDATCGNAQAIKGGAAVLYLSFFTSLAASFSLGVEVFKRVTMRCLTMVLIAASTVLVILNMIAYGYVVMEMDAADRSCPKLPPGNDLHYEVEGTWKCGGIACLFVIIAMFVYISNRYCRCCCAQKRGRPVMHRMMQVHQQYHHHHPSQHHQHTATLHMAYPALHHQQRYVFNGYPHAMHPHAHHHVAVFVPAPGSPGIVTHHGPAAVAYIYPPSAAAPPPAGSASPVQQGVVVATPTMPPASAAGSIFAPQQQSSASYSDTAAGATTAESDTPKSFH